MAATGLDVPAAIAEVDKTLKAWPARPTPAQRRRLAALFLAANDAAVTVLSYDYNSKQESPLPMCSGCSCKGCFTWF
jgi:hypothetical protein